MKTVKKSSIDEALLLAVNERFQKDYEQEFSAFPAIKYSFAKQGNAENAAEGFCVFYRGYELHLHGDSILGLIFGFSQLKSALKGNYLAEFLGSHAPKFPLRPIWIGCERLYSLSESIQVALPRWLTLNDLMNPSESCEIAKFCCRLLELGYNALILGSRSPEKKFQVEEGGRELLPLFALFHRYGIKVILKVEWNGLLDSEERTCCPADLQYQMHLLESFEEIKWALSSIDFLFWESCHLHPSFDQPESALDLTRLELIAAEEKLIERALGGSAGLIYYLNEHPSGSAPACAKWLQALCDEVEEGVVVAFSATCGDPRYDFLPINPLFGELRKSPDCSFTKMMPIVNAGSIGKGEGLWPVFSTRLVEQVGSYLYRHPFAGMIALANHLPAAGGVLDGSLWISSQVMWQSRSTSILAENWLLGNLPHWKSPMIAKALDLCAELLDQLCALRFFTERNKKEVSHELLKIQCEKLAAGLAELHYIWIKAAPPIKEEGNPPYFKDYLNFFLKDTARILNLICQNFSLTFPSLLAFEDYQDSIWTKWPASKAGGQLIIYQDLPPYSSDLSFAFIRKANRLL